MLWKMNIIFLIYFIVFHQIVNRFIKKKIVNKCVSVIYNYNFFRGVIITIFITIARSNQLVSNGATSLVAISFFTTMTKVGVRNVQMQY